MAILQVLKHLPQVLKKSVSEFISDEGMKLAASLSYYTIFSIAPFLLIVISIAGAAFGQEAVEGRVYGQIQQLIGQEAAVQIQNIIANVRLRDSGVWGIVIGAAILLIGASSVFTEIQGSVNYIWSIRTKPRKGWLKLLLDRLLSFSLVVGIGFILLVSLIVNSLMDALYERLERLFRDSSVHLLYLGNLASVFLVITALFTVIFKVLPDAKIGWKDSIAGATFTTVLFIIGKFLIGLYIGNSRLGAIYGTVASVFVILVWVYYTSIILYFGAEFTKVYSRDIGNGIKPGDQAVYIIKTESKELPSLRTAVKTDPRPGKIVLRKK
ncbi:YihY/virulence factor BrkB family protein [Sediminibacterium sp. WSJ-3]|nr:YihY/virulence factor BrkB family protein [Sediminibacterium soli]